METLSSLSPHWFWLALGLLLASTEIVAPGVFLIWMAGAALITGLVVWLFPIGWPLQIVLFAALAILAVLIARRFLRDHPVTAADPLMNRRADRLTGETAIVTEAIAGGTGRIRLGDSEWLAHGPDTAAGTRVRITGSDGAVLQVEPVE